jgi:EAL domain-containing protein (putative c-di-GMP-specific phosphodiesterase class I)
MSSINPTSGGNGEAPLPDLGELGRPDQDRLGRFFPALLAITLGASMVETTAAIVLGEPALASGALVAAFAALGATLARYQIRKHRPLRARVALAGTLTICAAMGAYLVPGVAPSMALGPVVAVVLVLRYVHRNRLLAVGAAAVASSMLILAIDAAAGDRSAFPEPIATVFHDCVLISIVLLLLLGLADWAMEARDSLRDLQSSSERHMRITTTRLSIVSALRVLHPQSTPEATADSIAKALGDLPLVDIAAIFEVSSHGEATVLAVSARVAAPVAVGEKLPAARAEYVLEKCRGGAWATPWTERNTPTLHDQRLTEIGIRAQAFAPIVSGDVIVGLVLIATTDPVQALHLVADLPSISEAAAVAGTILAPALLARRETSAARVQIGQLIAAGAFQPVFQPVVDLRTGMTVGFEALTRFSSGEPPDRVFKTAAEAGIGCELEAATVRAAVRDAAFLPHDAWLSLNVSPSFLGAYAELASILAGRNRPIILEVTEHDVIDDYPRLHAATRALGADIRLAVDDAGAGVANFRHLVDLHPDLVKVDAGMIRGVEADVSRQAMIVGLVHFAEVSGAQVLAEGIETQAERETVERLGVTLGQGYLLARPAPVGRWIEAPSLVRPRPSRIPQPPVRVALLH